MKLNLLILLATIILGFAAAYALQVTQGPKQIPLASNKTALTGKTLPAFSMQSLEGKTYQSKDFAGKTVLINLWASWCPPCVAEFPLLLELARNHPDDMVLLAISSDQSVEAIERFLGKLEEHDAKTVEQKNVIIVHDKNSTITFDVFQTVQLPETIIVSPAQQMVHKLVGVDWTLDEVSAFLPDKGEDDKS